MRKRENPCFRCDVRSTRCRLDCPKWAEYCSARDEEYKHPKHKAEAEYNDYRFNLHCRIEKRRKNNG